MLDTMDIILSLKSQGIMVLTIKEEFLQTLDSNIRKLILSILSWIAEYKRKRVKERLRRSMETRKTKSRPPKVKNETILRYYKEYMVDCGLNVADMWKIMHEDGIDISYSRLRQRIELRKQSKIIEISRIKL